MPSKDPAPLLSRLTKESTLLLLLLLLGLLLLGLLPTKEPTTSCILLSTTKKTAARVLLRGLAASKRTTSGLQWLEKCQGRFSKGWALLLLGPKKRTAGPLLLGLLRS